MLKIKITACLLSAIITGFFIASKTASQTQTGNTTKSKVVVAKAPTKCSVEAYGNGLASDEPKASIIRAKPDKNSAVVKTVTTKDEVVYYITGTNGGGWFEISKIETTGGDADEAIFEGRGWIPASILALSVGASDANLYALPRKKSRVVKKLIADESEARPIACQGNWMKIKSGKSTGWLSSEGQCANPLTTCS
jgi:SH3-like domain-containing protein